MKKWAIAAFGLVFFAGTALLFTASASSAEKPCGNVSYIVGKATVTHNGKTKALDMDSPIYNNDLVKTSDKSKVEISPNKSTGFSGTIRVAANTSFYFKVSDVKGEPASTLDLMAGQVGMKVAKLAGAPSAQVRTDTAACGVRGTDFEVVVTITGSLLVTCDEGEVGCLGIDGDEEAVGPEAPGGEAAQRDEGGSFQAVEVGKATLAELRDKWSNEKLTMLRANPRKAMAQLAGLYLKKKPLFDKAFDPLEKSDAFKRWQKEDGDPNFKPNPMSAQNLKDLKEVDKPIFAMRKELMLLERYVYRLEGIRSIVEGTSEYDKPLSDPSGQAILDDSGKPMTARVFFKKFDRERNELVRRIGMFRYAERLNAVRNPSGATGRTGADGDEGDQGNFFGDDAPGNSEDDFFTTE
jgi:hypothetical protein